MSTSAPIEISACVRCGAVQAEARATKLETGVGVAYSSTPRLDAGGDAALMSRPTRRTSSSMCDAAAGRVGT